MISLSRRMIGLLPMVFAAMASSNVWAQSRTADVGTSTVASPAAANNLSAFDKPTVPILDVALTEAGHVEGRVLDGNGKPVDGARVVIRREDELLHKLVTDQKGRFSAPGLKAGVYTIATVQGGGLYRLWPKNIAPPTARTQALVINDRSVLRGQYGTGALADWTSIGVGVAGLTVGIISLDKLNDLEDEVDDLRSP